MKKTIKERNIETLAELKRIVNLPLHKSFITDIKKTIKFMGFSSEETLNTYKFKLRHTEETVYGLQKVTVWQQLEHLETGEKRHKYESVPTLGGAYWECTICGRIANNGKLHKYVDGMTYNK